MVGAGKCVCSVLGLPTRMESPKFRRLKETKFPQAKVDDDPGIKLWGHQYLVDEMTGKKFEQTAGEWEEHCTVVFANKSNRLVELHRSGCNGKIWPITMLKPGKSSMQLVT